MTVTNIPVGESMERHIAPHISLSLCSITSILVACLLDGFFGFRFGLLILAGSSLSSSTSSGSGSGSGFDPGSDPSFPRMVFSRFTFRSAKMELIFCFAFSGGG